MKAYRMSRGMAALILNLSTVKNSSTHWIWGWMGPRARLGDFGVCLKCCVTFHCYHWAVAGTESSLLKKRNCLSVLCFTLKNVKILVLRQKSKICSSQACNLPPYLDSVSYKYDCRKQRSEYSHLWELCEVLLYHKCIFLCRMCF